MSLTSERDRRQKAPQRAGFQPRTADQLPRPKQLPERQVGRGLLAVIGALALVVGVPAALIYFVGNPLPTSMPDASWLRAELTAETIINVFAALIWFVWAHFVVCLISEARALRAGRMPSAMPFGSGPQLVARRLIAGILLLAGAATMTGNAPTSSGPPDTTVVATSAIADLSSEAADGIGDTIRGKLSGQAVSSLASATDQLRTATTPEPAVPGGTSGSGAAAGDSSDARAALKYYEVKPPQGRNYDTLWDIAERNLGDPFRYREIFDLNRDRPQPDGRRLVDADLIHPGWQLVMPADASGPDVYSLDVTPPPSEAAPADSPAPAPAPSITSETGAEVGAGAGSQAGAADATESTAATSTQGAALAGVAATTLADTGAAVGTHTDVAADRSGGAVKELSKELRAGNLGDLALGGGLLLAGLLLAIGARRGPYGTPGAPDQALRLAGRPERADLLDRALRALAIGRSRQQLPLPDISAVYVNDDQVVVHVAGRPEAPPQPWNQADEGRSWTVRREQLDGVPVDGPAPWPALVNVAQSHGYDLLVDLEYAPGLIALTGDAETSREVALSLVADLVTHQWSDAVDVTMVGFGDDLSTLAPDRITQVATLEEAVAQAQRITREQDSLISALEVDGVLAGRAAGNTQQLRPQVLVLSGAPNDDQAALLNDLTSHGRSVLTAVCVGNSLAARWRFTSDKAGNIDLGALGVSGVARRLTPRAVTDLRALLGHAASEAAQRATEAAVRAPEAVAAHITRPAVREADRDSAPARVELLGPVQVLTTGQVSAARRALLTELIVLVGLHPDGVHESVLKVSLWPRGVEDDVVRATILAAQKWLGSDASGRPLLAQGHEERWRLNPAVHIDWHEFADVAADHGDDPHRLLAALELATGEAFSALEPGRYAWLAFHQAARDARVLITATARKAASALVAAGDRGSAEQALRRGLTLVPTAQSLWRDLVRLHGDGGPGASAAVVKEMRLALAGTGLEPETEALISHLDPTQQIS